MAVEITRSRTFWNRRNRFSLSQNTFTYQPMQHAINPSIGQATRAPSYHHFNSLALLTVQLPVPPPLRKRHPCVAAHCTEPASGVAFPSSPPTRSHPSAARLRHTTTLPRHLPHAHPTSALRSLACPGGGVPPHTSGVRYRRRYHKTPIRALGRSTHGASHTTNILESRPGRRLETDRLSFENSIELSGGKTDVKMNAEIEYA